MSSQLIAFVVASGALLGSPGPGIAALIVSGRTRGVRGSSPLFGAMQSGLTLSATLSASGLAAVAGASPGSRFALTLVSALYLLWLAWSIATAPVGGSTSAAERGRSLGLPGGFILGAANPKAYLAFISLFGSFAIVDPPYGWQDSLLKAVVCITVTMIVDFLWVLVGVALGRMKLTATAEHRMNLSMAGAILLALCVTLV